MVADFFLLVPVLFPVMMGLCLALIPALDRKGARKAIISITLVGNALLVLPVLLSPDLEQPLFRLSENLPVFLHSDATGKCFAALISVVWCLAGFYSFEYMEHEGHLKRFYGFYLATLGILIGLCFAGSIITYYMFYELMTLLTVPLVMHTMDKEAVAAGIKYLIYSVLGASLVLLGIFILSRYVQSFSFAAGGQLNTDAMAGHETTVLAASMLMILGFGTKAGMFPLHGWLPTAHPVAPAPASAVLSGIITKAGVLGIIRVIYFLVGCRHLAGTWVQTAFMCLTLFTIFSGSLLAYKENLLKKRLAYSSVSQVSYVLFGLSTMSPLGFAGALLHVCAHSLIKDTLFMTAGAIIHKTGKTHTSELDGIGKQMPVTMWCFTLVSVGLVGIPPCLGFVSKWYLAQGSLSSVVVPGFLRVLGPVVLLISALLTAGYLLSVSIHGFFPGKTSSEPADVLEKAEPTWVMLVPMILLTTLSIVLGIFPGSMISLFQSIAGSLM